VLAAVPDTPVSAPISDATITNESRIKVFYGPLIYANNGGSAILSYELQIDNGIGGDFVSLIGADSESLETEFIFEQNV
jgi:hypothetical protein